MRSVLWFREADDGSRRIEAAGIPVFTVPLIATVPSDDLSGLDAATSRPKDYDGVFVTSRTAAEIIAERAARELHESGIPVFVLGRRTMEVLKRHISNLVFFPAADTAAEMLESLEGRVRKNGRYLFVRGESSMRTIPDALAGYAEVDECIVYRTTRCEISDPDLARTKAAMDSDVHPIACFFSPSAVDAFADQFGAGEFAKIGAASIGETTAAALRAFGIDPVVIAGEASGGRLAEDVIEFVKK